MLYLSNFRIEVLSMSTRFVIFTSATAAIFLAWITASGGSPEAIATDSDLGRLQGCWQARAGARREIWVVLKVQGRRVDAAISTPQGINLTTRTNRRPRSLGRVSLGAEVFC
jgi:hypothetical protein